MHTAYTEMDKMSLKHQINVSKAKGKELSMRVYGECINVN